MTLYVVFNSNYLFISFFIRDSSCNLRLNLFYMNFIMLNWDYYPRVDLFDWLLKDHMFEVIRNKKRVIAKRMILHFLFVVHTFFSIFISDTCLIYYSSNKDLCQKISYLIKKNE